MTIIKRLLSERARLPRRGVIRLGVANRCGKPVGQCGWCWEPNGAQKSGHGQEVDYFVLPEELKGLGQPKTLRVLLPMDDPDQVLTTAFVKYAGKSCVLKCDGAQAVSMPIDGKEERFPCRKPPVAEDGKPTVCTEGCKAEGRLNVVLLDGPLGVWQVVMGGEGRLMDLAIELRMYLAAFGRLSDIPFELAREPQQGNYRDTAGKRRTRQGYPVHLRSAFTAAQARQLRGLDPMALPPRPADLEEDDDEAAGLHVPAEVVPPPGDPPRPATVPAGFQWIDGAWRDPRVARPDEEQEFDISLAYRAAVNLAKVTPQQYGSYLVRQYGSVDGMTHDQLAEERKWYFRCREDAEAPKEWRERILGAALPKAVPAQGRLV